MKILINTPLFSLLGGVSSHYRGLQNFWNERVKYNVVGKRGSKCGSGIYWLPWDIVKFIFRLLTFRPNIVVLNPSLGQSALKRDFIFLNIAHLLGFKTAVFIHGFNWNIAQTIDREWVAKNLNKTSLIFVLAKSFEIELRNWGVSTPIALTTTKVDDKLLTDLNIDKRVGKVRNILFLARMEKEKGIYEAIKTYELLKDKYPFLTLTIVGDGNELHAVKKYLEDNSLNDVRITGELNGKNLIGAFEDADLYIFPSYGEGMPTSVLEAMAFGLPVVTRKVGGLVDFFENEKMGYITDSLDPQHFANAIMLYIENENLTKEVSKYNYEYAKEHFMASHVAQKIEEQLKQIVNG